jgi:pyruvate formate-lyase activating enzyme-like uncharacterized protein
MQSWVVWVEFVTTTIEWSDLVHSLFQDYDTFQYVVKGEDMLKSLRDKIIQDNQAEFKDRYHKFRWLTAEEGQAAAKQRQDVLSALEGKIHMRAKGTKPHFGPLSPGCELCAQGQWSCLFVNGICNCCCFYCPAEQNSVDMPMTNRISFLEPQEYIEYLEKFGFRGVGLSGGEPLMTLKTTLRFAEKVKKRFGERIYIWLYTNGTLVDADKLSRLADAGVNEIRFDIGATAYDLSKVGLAVGTIGRVTVEIPAVPEDVELMKKVIPAMKDMGIDHLNLHQIRVTPYNADKLLRRGYRFIPGEKVTVLESELAALELMSFSLQQVGLPVNYCSFVYRHRYQNAAAKAKSAGLVQKGHESLTESGMIRTLIAKGTADDLACQAQALTRNGGDPQQWLLGSEGRDLLFHPGLWELLDFSSLELHISYQASTITGALSYFNPFAEFRLTTGRSIFVERYRIADHIQLRQEDEIRLFHARFLKGNKQALLPHTEKWDKLAWCEEIPEGLQDYVSAAGAATSQAFCS